MNSNIKYLCLFAISCAGLCTSPPSHADETPESALANARLTELRGRIQMLTSHLSSQLAERDALNARLRQAELEITTLRRELDGLRGAELDAERRRRDLAADETRVQQALHAERAGLASEVRAAYMLGEQERLKLLLSQGDPASAGRMSAYYGYFARERARKISDINQRVSDLDRLAVQLDQVTATLTALQRDTTREVTELQRARAERRVALTAVTQQVQNGSQELSRLKREEQAEEALLADLAQVLRDYPVDAQQGFAELRGKLPWPVSGKMTARFSDERANGVLIESTRGAKVRAPYSGRVLYADWLQGLGLLLIIGHSGDYMTLYGHAEVLYKSVGDWVAPGDVIAAMSDSSAAAPHLYFEIREGRTPRDPKLWLKAAP